MNIALWKSDDHVIFSEQFFDTEANIATYHPKIPIGRRIDPEVRIKNKRIVTKVVENDERRWVRQYGFLFFYRLLDQLRHPPHRGSIRDTHTNLCASQPIDQGPIDHGVFEKNAVRDEEMNTVDAANTC